MIEEKRKNLEEYTKEELIGFIIFKDNYIEKLKFRNEVLTNKLLKDNYSIQYIRKIQTKKENGKII